MPNAYKFNNSTDPGPTTDNFRRVWDFHFEKGKSLLQRGGNRQYEKAVENRLPIMLCFTIAFCSLHRSKYCRDVVISPWKLLFSHLSSDRLQPSSLLPRLVRFLPQVCVVEMSVYVRECPGTCDEFVTCWLCIAPVRPLRNAFAGRCFP